MWLFVVFLLVPMIEIALFIKVGGLIGLWPTLALTVVIAILGSWLVRQQGLRALADLQNSMQSLRNPAEPAGHGLLILFAGLLCMTPGFFTDAVGLALLLPPVRSMVIAYVARRVSIVSVSAVDPRPNPGASTDDEVIDGDFSEVPPRSDSLPPSGWTRH